MPERSRSALLAGRAVAWTIGWAFSAARYLRSGGGQHASPRGGLAAGVLAGAAADMRQLAKQCRSLPLGLAQEMLRK